MNRPSRFGSRQIDIAHRRRDNEGDSQASQFQQESFWYLRRLFLLSAGPQADFVEFGPSGKVGERDDAVIVGAVRGVTSVA
jgi:hypothetical protein